jgi:glycosyltransferase involved in cell wall biosynthesis
MRLCHIVPSLEDRHGGPSKSVRALANAEAGLGASVDLLSTLEPGQPPPQAGDAANLKVFAREPPLRLCHSRGLRDHLEATDYDCVHSHALWLLTLRYAHRAAQRLQVPLIISPRGMLSGWAYRHHHWRKLLAALLVHPGALAGADGWHATSAGEAEDIRRLGFTQPVCVAPNGVTLPTEPELAAARAAWLAACPSAAGRRIALFYSRFHRKKRLRELIGLWLAAPRGDWLLLVVGVPEEYSAAEVNQWVAARGGRAQIAVFDGADRPPPFAVASLFLLPSHSENFGLVVAEALAAGVPALVTDTTPWSGLAANDAGWCVPWTDYGRALNEALRQPPGTLATTGGRGRAWVARDFTWDRSAGRLLDFYQELRHG